VSRVNSDVVRTKREQGEWVTTTTSDSTVKTMNETKQEGGEQQQAAVRSKMWNENEHAWLQRRRRHATWKQEQCVVGHKRRSLIRSAWMATEIK
jgi:hypothetical protein